MATEVVENGILKSVVLDEGETSYATSSSVRVIGSRAIGADFAAGIVTLSDECEEVQDFAFFNNRHVKTLRIGSGLQSMSSHAFAYRNPLESIEVSADNDMFSSVNGCLCNKSGTVICLGVNAEVTELASNINSVSENAFAYCGGIRTLRLNDALESIGAYAFCDCTGIENIYVAANVVAMGKGAFCGCGGVNTITIDGSRNVDGTNVVNLLKIAFADIGKVSQVKITGRVGEIALLLGDGTFANTAIHTLVDTAGRLPDELPYAEKYRTEDEPITATFSYADPADPSHVFNKQVVVSTGMPFGTLPQHGEYEGFSFDGWFYQDKEAFGAEPITRDSIVKPTQNFTVVGKYTVQMCTVRFYDSDKTTIVAEYTVEYGETVVAPQPPPYDTEEYVFMGWLLQGPEPEEVQAETGIEVKSNMDFVARIVRDIVFDYEVIRTETGYYINVLGFNPYMNDDEIKIRLEIAPGIYRLAIPDIMEVKVGSEKKRLKVRTVGYEPIYDESTGKREQIDPIDATKPDGTPLKPFGYFGRLEEDKTITFKDVTIGTNVTKVNDYAFRGFMSEKLVLPYALARVGKYAFGREVAYHACEVRMENRIVNGVLEDNYNAAMCPVGENFVKIGEGAFSGIAYEKVVLEYETGKAYSDGTLLRYVIYDEHSSKWYSVWRVTSSIIADENLSFDAIKSKLEAYARFYLRLQNSIAIGARAFEEAGIDHFDGTDIRIQSIPKACFPANRTMAMNTRIATTSVGESAFEVCYSIKDYPCEGFGTGPEDPSPPIVIGMDAFRECTFMDNLQSLLTAVSAVGDAAFYHVGSQGEAFELAHDNLDNAVIGSYAFAKSKLSGITINPEIIKSYAFSNCPNLTDVNLSREEYTNPLTIMSYAFTGSPIETFTAHLCISIGKYALAGISSLRLANIYAPAGRKCDLGSSVFRGCSGEKDEEGIIVGGLEEVVLQGGGDIGSSCFRDCKQLSTADIEAVSIGEAAFYNDISLVNLIMGTAGLRDIGANAFNSDKGSPMQSSLFWNPIDSVYGLRLLRPLDGGGYGTSGYSWLVHSASTPEVVHLDSIDEGDEVLTIAGIAQKTFRGKASGGTKTVYLPEYGSDVYKEGSDSERLLPRICQNAFFGFTGEDQELVVYMPSPCSIANSAFNVTRLLLRTTLEVKNACEYEDSEDKDAICTGEILWQDYRGSPL